MWIVNECCRYDGEVIFTYFFHKKENAEACFRAIAKKDMLRGEKDEGSSPEEYEHDTWDEVIDEFLEYGKWKEVVSITHIGENDFSDKDWEKEI